MITSVCPHCSQSIEADDSFAGTSAVCPTCGGEFQVAPKEKENQTKSTNMKKNPTMIISIGAIVIATISLLLQLGTFSRTSLDFDTPEDAIRSLAELNQSGSFKDFRRAQTIFRDDSDWEGIAPKKIQIAKTLEVKDTGDSDYDGGALCFLKFKKDDGIDSHKVVFLKKNKKGMFTSGYLASAIEKEYGHLIKKWEKDGSLE